MDVLTLLNHLSNKEETIELEAIAKTALKDTEYLTETNTLEAFRSYDQFDRVLQTPTTYDQNNANYQAYIKAITLIASTFTIHLYNKKGKYTSLKSSIEDIEEKVNSANTAIENIEKTSSLVTGATILDSYAQEFKTRADHYKTEADSWKKYLLWSFTGFSIFFGVLVFSSLIDTDLIIKLVPEEVHHFGYLAILTLKIIIILMLLQVVRFFNRNYNANMHLYQQSLHKSDVLKSLRGIYNTLPRESQERDELIKTGALIAFKPIESGYISLKEGAGNADDGIYSALNSFINRQ